MKANEAPKKLYVDTEDRLSDSILYGFTQKRKEDDIEYIRKDALIEKAVRRLENYLDNGMWIANDVGYREKEAIIEDFREYMKGE
jgi:hypothetical protein